MTLTVSTGPPVVIVPDVRRAKRHRRRDRTRTIRMDRGHACYSSEQPDTVTVRIAPGDHAAVKGTDVRVNVSRGAKPIGVPDVTGQPYANAESALRGPAPRRRTRRRPVQAGPGRRRRREPDGRYRGLEGAKITLSVSKGPPSTRPSGRHEPVGGDRRDAAHRSGADPALIYEPSPIRRGTDRAQRDPSGGEDATERGRLDTVGRFRKDAGGDGSHD